MSSDLDSWLDVEYGLCYKELNDYEKALEYYLKGYKKDNRFGTFMVVVATVVGAYMALNIGANDVANNMGPAVGSNALTLGSALLIAAIFETAGAMLAGGEVVNTIASGIVSPEVVQNADTFILLMMAALLAAALWLNLATYIGAPVSTTHAVVGGVVGAGIMATGMIEIGRASCREECRSRWSPYH